MKEEILITSKISKKAQITLIDIIIVLVLLAIISFIYTVYISKWFKLFTICIPLIVHWVLLSVATLLAIILFVLTKRELTLTTRNIIARNLFGRQVVLPLHMVTAYATGDLFSIIAVSTARGHICHLFVRYYQEIGDMLRKLINERQSATEIDKATPAPKNKFDDLSKLKELLNNGIITQEEFDEKKKQILKL